MVGRKTTKAAPEVAPQKVLSHKEIVQKKFKSAICEPVKTGFCILDQKDKGSPVNAGLAKSEGAAWKLAAHSVL